MNYPNSLHWGIVSSLNEPAVFHVTATEHDAEQLVASAPRWVETKLLRGGHCRSKTDLIHQWIAAFQLPTYCRDNWDSFSSCIFDPPINVVLGGLPVGLAVVAVFTESELVLENEDPTELDVLVDIIRQRSEEVALPRTDAEIGQFNWPIRLAVVFQTTPDATEVFTNNLLDSRITIPVSHFDND